MQKMDMSSIPIYGSLKRYWSGRTYQRLDGSGFTVKRNVRVLRLGGSSSTRRSRKIREAPKLQLKIKSPVKKLLGKLREGYINIMLGLAGNVGYLGDSRKVSAEKRIPRRKPIAPSVSKLEEFDKKLILQMYSSISASREFVV